MHIATKTNVAHRNAVRIVKDAYYGLVGRQQWLKGIPVFNGTHKISVPIPPDYLREITRANGEQLLAGSHSHGARQGLRDRSDCNFAGVQRHEVFHFLVNLTARPEPQFYGHGVHDEGRSFADIGKLDRNVEVIISKRLAVYQVLLNSVFSFFDMAVSIDPRTLVGAELIFRKPCGSSHLAYLLTSEDRVGNEESEANKLGDKLGIIPDITFLVAGYLVAQVGWRRPHFRTNSGSACVLSALILISGILLSVRGRWVVADRIF